MAHETEKALCRVCGVQYPEVELDTVGRCAECANDAYWEGRLVTLTLDKLTPEARTRLDDMMENLAKAMAPDLPPSLVLGKPPWHPEPTPTHPGAIAPGLPGWMTLAPPSMESFRAGADVDRVRAALATDWPMKDAEAVSDVAWEDVTDLERIRALGQADMDRARAEWEAGEPERAAARLRAEERRERALQWEALSLYRAETLLARTIRNYMAGRVKWSSVEWYRLNQGGPPGTDMAGIRLGHRENDVSDIRANVAALRAVRARARKLNRP